MFASSFGVKEVEAAKKKKSSGIKVGVSVRFAGAVFNAVIGFAVAIALNYLDIGTQIAKQLDKRDKRPNNGWVDIY
ncbi:hypothetical protein P5485_016180 [Bacillus pumilus]|uniref:hypothetical protein n=1 Tax=Bacillus TaxID=1386 RepID=UPI0007764CC4|nr:hypothetical protein [Bacillus pumilus]AMM98725.1 hypothetical protein UP12_15795 [Bacillus pumilus]MDH3149164.1 hypothetical protein [Bacillus pumilus]